MKSARTFRVVLVTVPSIKAARTLSRAVLDARLVACANIVPRIESHYWWDGRVEQGRELLVIFKTTRARLAALEKLIVAKHPYETPEFLVLPLESGNARYLDWITASTRVARP